MLIILGIKNIDFSTLLAATVDLRSLHNGQHAP
jgi:hypothetical protein